MPTRRVFGDCVMINISKSFTSPKQNITTYAKKVCVLDNEDTGFSAAELRRQISCRAAADMVSEVVRKRNWRWRRRKTAERSTVQLRTGF